MATELAKGDREFVHAYVKRQFQLMNLARHVAHRGLDPDEYRHGCTCPRCVAVINRNYARLYGD